MGGSKSGRDEMKRKLDLDVPDNFMDFDIRIHFDHKEAVGWCMYNKRIITLSIAYVQHARPIW